ncbi:MAG TPA: D-alanine--D-alanine ligase [Isosphaeraceae bacterium]
MRIGIAFDLAPTGLASDGEAGPDDQFEEFDKPETVEAIAGVLRARGHEVTLLGDGPEFLRRILDDPPDLVWNMAEGTGVGRCREARVPAVLEMLGIPYTGSDPLTLAATLDKDVAKRLVASDGSVKVPDGRALPPGLEQRYFAGAVESLFAGTVDPVWREPVLLKPSFEGSSKGIHARCLAWSTDDAWSVYRELSANYHQTILVEEFIRGEEVTVGIVGNVDDASVEIVGTMHIVSKQDEENFVYSLEAKRDWRNRIRYEAPPRLFVSWTRDRLSAAARACYERLGCRDVARIDFRVRSGIPYFIEANPLPGLAPVTSDLVILAKGHGIEYDDLIGRIFEAALARLGLDEHFPGTSRR